MPGFTSRARATLAALTSLAIFGGVAIAAPGDLDPSFSGNGVYATDYGEESTTEFRDVETLPDGGLLLAGRTRHGTAKAGPLLIQLREDGSPDPAFGGDGVIESVIPTPGLGGASAVKRLDDGRILLAGWTARGDEGIFVARLLPDGTLDPSFADGGVKRIDVAGSLETTQSDSLILRNERIYIGVRARTPEGPPFRVGVVALEADDGEFFGRFGAGGKALVPKDVLRDHEFGWLPLDSCTGCIEHDIGVDEQGRVIITGTTWEHDEPKMKAVRLLRDGKLDRDYFGKRGEVVIDFARKGTRDAGSYGGPIVVRPDGSALIVGPYRNEGRGSVEGGYAVAALNRAGGLDRTFSNDGRQVIPSLRGGEPKDAILDSEGRLLIGGWVFERRVQYLALARLRTSGQRDRSLGAGGASVVGVRESAAWALATDDLNRILAAGFLGEEVALQDGLAVRLPDR